MRINLAKEENPEIGLIALIDCIFFLLMFFMLATSFNQHTEMQRQSELTVVLPEANASLEASVSSPTVMNVVVDKKGNLFLHDKPVSLQTLGDALKDASEKNKQMLIEISGDETTDYKYIVSVIDMCQFEGLTNIALRTRTK